MKEAIESAKAAIAEIQQEVDQALSQAKNDIDIAKLNAEEKLNAALDQISHQTKNQHSSRSRTSFLFAILWLAPIALMIAGLAGYATTIDFPVDLTKFLPEFINESYVFPSKVAFFTVAALYPIFALFLTSKTREAPEKKVVFADKGCQTIDNVSFEFEPPITSNSLGESVKREASIASKSTVTSLSESDLDVVESDNDASQTGEEEVVHSRFYVKPIRLVHDEWKSYGPLILSLSHIKGKPCMVFRNDIGVVHLNLPIAQGMTFEKVDDKHGLGKFIRFVSVSCESEGLECFMLKVSSKVMDKLHLKLVEMAA